MKKQDGELCSANTECTHGACSGRCCLGCTCTQPSAANVLKNTGFDKDTSGWAITGGTIAQMPFSDADACPYSGSLVATATGANLAELTQCVSAVALSGTFNFGTRMLAGQANASICGVRFFLSPDCTGDEIVDDELLGPVNSSEWQSPSPETAGPVPVTNAHSVLFFCEIGGTLYLDEPFISKIPATY
ncbi:MAG TPA: hypothetical protein VGK52_16600 [Polyangia bacterium]